MHLYVSSFYKGRHAPFWFVQISLFEVLWNEHHSTGIWLQSRAGPANSNATRQASMLSVLSIFDTSVRRSETS